jgi:hypothetical protein
MTMPGNHEGTGDPENLVPRQAVGKDQRQRAGDQAGDAVGVDVHGVAQAQLVVAQNFAAEGVDRNVLCSRQKRRAGRQATGWARCFPGIEAAEEADGSSKPICVTSIQPRRRPKPGTLKRSSSGDQRNFQV